MDRELKKIFAIVALVVIMSTILLFKTYGAEEFSVPMAKYSEDGKELLIGMMTYQKVPAPPVKIDPEIARKLISGELGSYDHRIIKADKTSLLIKNGKFFSPQKFLEVRWDTEGINWFPPIEKKILVSAESFEVIGEILIAMLLLTMGVIFLEIILKNNSLRKSLFQLALLLFSIILFRAQFFGEGDFFTTITASAALIAYSMISYKTLFSVVPDDKSMSFTGKKTLKILTIVGSIIAIFGGSFLPVTSYGLMDVVYPIFVPIFMAVVLAIKHWWKKYAAGLAQTSNA